MAQVGQFPLKFVKISTAASGATELVAAATGKRYTVVNYALVSTSANAIKFQSASTDLTGAMAMGANGGVSAIGHPESPLFPTAVGEALNINLSAATQVSGHLSYLEG